MESREKKLGMFPEIANERILLARTECKSFLQTWKKVVAKTSRNNFLKTD